MSQPSGAPREPLEVGVVFASHYEILRPLGDGGYAITYQVRETHSGACRALKVLHLELAGNEIQMRRFRKEAELIARVKPHPGVRQVMECGRTADGTLYMELEYLEGRDLADLLARSHTLPTPYILRIGIQLATAVGALHAQGIVHRDVKPENIFLTGGARKGLVKLIDFGVAWCREGAHLWDNTGVVQGTPAYMAPEQLEGHPPDPRADLYSLGAVLYEMLTGHIPHQGMNPFDIWARARRGNPRTIREVRLDVPPHLEAIVRWLLAPNPEDRPQSAAALKYHLERVLLPNYF